VLQRLRLRHRIGLLVLLAAIALVSVTAVTLVLGRRSKQELIAIETHYVPLVELDRDLKTMFAAVTRALEDAASAADEGRLADADRLDRELRNRLASGRETIAGNGYDAAVLERDYTAYFTSARQIAAALVAGTPTAQLHDKIAAMQATQQVLATHLEAATTPDRRRLTAAFEAARESQEDAERIHIAVALAAIALLGLVSWWIARRAVRALQEVSVGVQRLASGELGQDIRVTSGDEIGDLAREANRTAARLREYRERTGTLLAETQRQAREVAVARQAEQERAEAAENATRELEAFSYSVAHDLRAPLRSIHGFSAALTEDFGDTIGPEAASHLARISAGAVRMGELIDALLELSRVSRAELTRKPVSLTKIANDVVTQLTASEPSRTVQFIIQDGLRAHGDPQLLRVLLENLLGNAWKFVAKRTAGKIELGQSEDGSFYVRDNGAGFDMAYAAKLFMPFQRLHAVSDYPGTGIGLATVQRIVRRHGGKIWAEGAINQGATFHFTLATPVHEETTHALG
jgi:signal transduction histidine kinase